MGDKKYFGSELVWRINEVVQDFNTYIRKFPNNLMSGMFGFEKKGYFGSNKNVTEEDPNANNPFKQGPVTPHGSGSPFDVIPGNGTKNP